MAFRNLRNQSINAFMPRRKITRRKGSQFRTILRILFRVMSLYRSPLEARRGKRFEAQAASKTLYKLGWSQAKFLLQLQTN